MSEIRALLDYADCRLSKALRSGRVEIKEPLRRIETSTARKPRDGSTKEYKKVSPSGTE